jgi:4-diphosphocytidyl-2-C-methyl-D-erythritol kinase
MRWHRAPAKINLTLRVVGRRADGLHEIESLVAFGGICDWVGYDPGPLLELQIEGPHALEAGPVDGNLILRAARRLALRIPGLRLGRFRLIKFLPAAAGMGGGSADAAAALRMLAGANGLGADDERVRAAAQETGADVSVCLDPASRMMTGTGDKIAPPIALARAFAVLVNPRVAVPTRHVFDALGLAQGSRLKSSGPPIAQTPITLQSLVSFPNDLESPARRVAPIIGTVLDTLSRLPEVQVTRMSGSGATCFGLFDNPRSASIACSLLAADRPDWWVKATRLR